MRADTWGPVGSAVAAACCLGLAPVVTALGAVGLGFVLHDVVLIPLLALFLGVTVWQLYRDRRRHGRTGPVWLVVPGALLTLAGLWLSPAAVAVGLAAVFVASFWNLALVWRSRRRTAS